jgi:type I restriction enzyme M protein
MDNLKSSVPLCVLCGENNFYHREQNLKSENYVRQGTKRKIDTARDILVGKVPDPKSQVEQITIALIYKFMDDMDREAVELGGKKRFFTGEYERYAWSKIVDPRIGGFEMINLYSEAIIKLNQNPNLPQLFRDIFKNAYLPYRDPETLKLFLKTINEFTYDHSERLGDAFEYLLSVLGSQGEAGQFRTPRHIIDFMVQIIDPQKHETILDPACGTSGFLISAYKHILKENTSPKYRDQNGNNGNYRGDLLTVEERKNLFKNFKGYDISPDMVRLSLVNMYLHGFVQPQIYEYDTLTSEDRWNEYADVILANPPFMTPKGGIKPHKRFSVQSNRSEVLFVDYITEHLNPSGRAGVIVPEGIIFQSAKAYKQLRKMLVENYLYAVVSLPAGVFQPYSGVKTSILLMDKQLARKTDSILFVKIENDGFDLGAQRRPIDKNDLPDAANVIKEYIKALREGKIETFTADEKPCGALLVKKEKIAENGEYNLTGDRYRITEKIKHQKWPMVRLGELFLEIRNGRNVEQLDDKGKYRVSRIQTISDGTFDLNRTKWTNDEVDENDFLKEGDILLSHINSVEHLAKTAIFTDIDEKVVHGVNLIRFRADTTKINPFYAINIFKSFQFLEQSRSFAQKAVNQASIKTSDLKSILIPLPPPEVQQEIVAEIEGYQKLIDGCRQVIDSWKPDIKNYLEEELKLYLQHHPELQEELKDGWKMVRLGEVCEKLFAGGDVPSNYSKVKVDQYQIPILTNGIGEKSLYGYTNIARVKKRCVTISARGTIGYPEVRDEPFYPAIRLIVAVPNEKLLMALFLKYILNKKNFNSTGNTIQQLTVPQIKTFSFPLPPLEVQERIVARIEAERKVIDGCRELIKTYEEKIKRVIDKVWDE